MLDGQDPEKERSSDSDSDQEAKNIGLLNAIRKKSSKISQQDRLKEIEEYLNEANIDLVDKNNKNNTILHLAVRKNYPEIVKFLLEKGAKIDIRNSEGKTPLDLARNQQDQNLIEILTNHNNFQGALLPQQLEPLNSPEIIDHQDSFKIKITDSSSYKQMLDILKQNQGIMVFEIDSQQLSPYFLEQDSFYNALDKAKNLFFVDITINETITVELNETINTKLRVVKNPLLIQIGSLSGTKVYVKELSKKPIILDLNAPPVEKFDKDTLDNKLSNTEEFGLPLIVEALKLGLIGKFNDETDCHRSLSKVAFETIKEAGKEIEYHYYILSYRAITHDNFLLARLLSLYYQDIFTLYSNYEPCTYDKKDPGYDPSTLLKLAAKDASVNTIAALLKLQFPLPEENIPLPKNEVNLLELSTLYYPDTPLLIATKANKKDNVDFFIRCGVDINKSANNQSAIDAAWNYKYYDIVLRLLKANSNLPTGVTLEDIFEKFHEDMEWKKFFDNIPTKKQKLEINLAWKKKHYDVVLRLLKADSDFPEGFILKEIPENEEWKTFFDNRNKLHTLIKDGKLEEVKELVSIVDKSRFYLNEKGKSALLTTIESNNKEKYEIYAYLYSQGVNFKDGEQGYIHSLRFLEKEKLKEALVPYFPQTDDAHILYLVSKSRSSQPTENFREKVETLYKELDAIPEISSILKVIQCSDNVDIIFDYTQESIIGIDPTSKDTTKGRCLYDKGRLYIGAKNESELAGTLAHELTHLAMQIVYNNNCNPYFDRLNDSNELEFNELTKNIKEACESDPDSFDDIIKRVFDVYSEIDWASELVVRVPHMLAKYGKVIGEELLKKQAFPLLQYYKDNIIPKCNYFVQEAFLMKPRNNIKLLNQYLGLIDSIKKLNIKFDELIDFTNFLSNKNKNILVLNTKSTLLSNINVYQFLQKTSPYSTPDSYLFLKFNEYKTREEN